MLRIMLAIAALWFLNARFVMAAVPATPSAPLNLSAVADQCNALAAYRRNCISVLNERGLLNKIPPDLNVLLTISSTGKLIELQVINTTTAAIYYDETLKTTFDRSLPRCEALPEGSAVAIILRHDSKLQETQARTEDDVVVATAKVGDLELLCWGSESRVIRIPAGTYLVLPKAFTAKAAVSSEVIVFSQCYLASLSSDSSGVFTYRGISLRQGVMEIAKRESRTLVRVQAGNAGHLMITPASNSAVFIQSGSLAEIVVAKGYAFVSDLQVSTLASVDVTLHEGEQYRSIFQ